MAISEHFSNRELACPCCGQNQMDAGFLARLEEIRAVVGPMRVSSGYRCPEHNKAVSSTGEFGPHTTGHAVDIVCSGNTALTVIEQALLEGMTGIGVKQKGPHDRRFIHLDNLAEGYSGPRPWIWSY